MAPAEVLDIGKEAIFVLLKITTPIMLIAMVVGLIVALFQALTQIQEMTLTFVPKIIAIFVSLLLFLPIMSSYLMTFTEKLYDRMISL